MPAILSKEESAACERQRTVYILCFSIFSSVLQHVIQLQAEPLLIRRLVNNDPVTTAKVMANTSGAIGILGLLVNQFGGKLSDVIGRRPLFYLGPIVSVVMGIMTHQFSRSFNVVVGARIARILFTGFSSSVMCSAALSDVLSGKELSVAWSHMGAAIGASVIVAPVLEGIILDRTHMDITKPSLALSALGVLHTIFLYIFLPETNAKADTTTPLSQVLKSLDLSSINPLNFLTIFREDQRLKSAKQSNPDSPEVDAAIKNRTIVSQLIVIATLQSFLEGKNVTDIVQVWQREHLKWDAFRMRDFTVMYGVLCYLVRLFLSHFSILSFFGLYCLRF